MAESGSKTFDSDEILKSLQDMNKNLDQMLEEMEKISVEAAGMSYEMVAIRSNPALVEKVRRLHETFQQCLKDLEKNWKETLEEAKSAP